MREEPLTGGNMDPVVRVGETVRRVSGDWTDAVHELLEHYAAAGITATPRPLGLDERGREVLSYIDGSTLDRAEPDLRWHEATLRAAAELLRRMHDASAALAQRRRVWRGDHHQPVEVICHNDFAPYNLIVHEGRLAGAIDFDMASPGPRSWDLAYLAYRLVPYVEDAVGFDPARHGDREDRLAMLIEAYGHEASPAELRGVTAARVRELAAFTERRAADTDRPELADHAAMYRRDAERLGRRD